MASWTLRPQKHHGERRTSSAALRAERYVRRHANEFHGAGVADAVQDLPEFIRASQKAQDALARLVSGYQIPIELVFDGTPLISEAPIAGYPEETAHGLTVVGWKGENGCAHCLGCRPMGGTMITAADLDAIGTVLCLRCGTQLGLVTDAAPIRPAECPDCSHPHVEAHLCTVPVAAGFCGCTG